MELHKTNLDWGMDMDLEMNMFQFKVVDYLIRVLVLKCIT